MVSPSRRDDPARVVAVTGARQYLGRRLVMSLEEDRRCARALALDIQDPDLPFERGAYVPLDLTAPTAGAELAELFAREQVDTVVHAAFLSRPTHAAEWAHELEDVGTMHVVDACAAAGVRELVLVSTTQVYGASPVNPNYLSEHAELRGHADSRFITDRIRAERQVSRFARENAGSRVVVLRFAPILGPTVDNLFTRFFSRPIAPVMMGFDPLLQFVHETDAVYALERAIHHPSASGPFNIAGKGVLPYTTVLALMGRVPVPMPHFMARPVSRALWATQVVVAPPSFLDFLRYPCVADGSRARDELGFQPAYPIKRTILDFLGVSPEDGRPDFARAHG